MIIKNTKNYIYILLVLLFVTSLYLFREYSITNHQFGFPLDDSWIHIRYAENLASGYLFHYNIGEATPGTTSPLWSIILSVPFLLSYKFYYAFTIIAGLMFFLLVCFEVYKISLILGFNKNFALLTGILTLICGRLIWASLSGMEVSLFSYLILLVTRLHLCELETGKIKIITGILLGLSATARPESYLFAFIYYSASLFLFKDKLRLNLRSLLISLILFIIIAAPYPIFCYLTTGGFFPNTFRVQNTSIKPDINYFMEAGIMFLKDNMIILLLFVEELYFFIDSIFMKKMDRKILIINLWIISLPLVFSFIAPNLHHHGRYLMPLIPFMTIAAIYIFIKRMRLLKLRGIRQYNNHIAVLVVFLIALSTISAYGFSRTFGTDVLHINNQQVRVANWLNDNLPNESCFGTHDIGALAFITKKKIFDMEGLVNPEVFKLKKLPESIRYNEMMSLLNKNGVNYIIIYPNWYPGFVESYSQKLENIYSAPLEEGTGINGQSLIVYKIHWEDFIE